MGSITGACRVGVKPYVQNLPDFASSREKNNSQNPCFFQSKNTTFKKGFRPIKSPNKAFFCDFSPQNIILSNYISYYNTDTCINYIKLICR
jgi:hypothetical protein